MELNALGKMKKGQELFLSLTFIVSSVADRQTHPLTYEGTRTEKSSLKDRCSPARRIDREIRRLQGG